MKKVLVVGMVLLFAVGMAYAVGNQERGTIARTTSATPIGTCEPETDVNAAGWDTNPYPGNWGGKDESDFAVVWEPGTPDIWKNSGRMAECTIPGQFGETPATVKIHALRGLANDDYCVFASIGAGDLLIGCVDDNQGGEAWVTDTFTLPAGAFAAGQDVTVKILVTGNSWQSFATWGQLGVDWIKVYP
jgi:hypothetical protein